MLPWSIPLLQMLQGEASTSAAPAPAEAPAAPEPVYTRTFRSLGSDVIESNREFEEPAANDIWEGEKFEVGAR